MSYLYLKTYIRNKWAKIFLQSFHKDKLYEEYLFEMIWKYYTEEHRYYHNISHIADCLRKLDEYKFYVDPYEYKLLNIEAITLAIWFHDIIYQPAQKNNEERSAELARVVMYNMNPEIYLKRKDVYDLILLTKHERVNKLNDSAKLLLDIDLSILGSDREKFEVFEMNIREEYAWVPENVYKVERVKIINGFLNLAQVYNTRHFKLNYEMKAFENLKWLKNKYEKI
jgi:predicted metal-dependent HD superfamily phosphohydrolase